LLRDYGVRRGTEQKKEVRGGKEKRRERKGGRGSYTH
jgi:hypothetical protein